MKSTFSTSWQGSTQPRKQRKFRYNAPLHIKGRFLNAKLSKDLAKKHNLRSLRVRSGDKVEVMRGQFKGKVGSVDRVDLARERVYVNGVELNKKDGGKVPYPIHPSNVMITTIGSSDKRRLPQTKETKKATAKVEEKTEAKAEAKKGEQ